MRRPFLLLPVAGFAVAGLAITFSEAADKGVDQVLFSGQDALGPLISDASTLVAFRPRAADRLQGARLEHLARRLPGRTGVPVALPRSGRRRGGCSAAGLFDHAGGCGGHGGGGGVGPEAAAVGCRARCALDGKRGRGGWASHHRRGGGRLSHNPAVVGARILRGRQPTAAGGSRPSMTAITFSAQRRAIASRVVAVADPMWGRRTVWAGRAAPAGRAARPRRHRGRPRPDGRIATHRPAPASRPRGRDWCSRVSLLASSSESLRIDQMPCLWREGHMQADEARGRQKVGELSALDPGPRQTA